jgi:hypothetical protein
MRQHLESAKQGKHNRTLQNTETTSLPLAKKPYTKKNFPATTKHRVNTYATGIARVLSFIRLIKGCNLKGWVDKFTWQQQVEVVTFNSQTRGVL